MATGISHKRNVAKFRILDAAYHLQVFEGRKDITVSEIAEFTGMSPANISRRMYSFFVNRYRYFKRGDKDGFEYTYTLTAKGIETYKTYLQRFKSGLELNLTRRVPKKMRDCPLVLLRFNKPEDFMLNPEDFAPYIRTNMIGITELGLKNTDVLKAAGLKKE